MDLAIDHSLDPLVSKLSAIVPGDDETYLGDDGLLYCQRCNTPRQVRVEFLGNVKTVRCLCKCMTEERDRAEAREKREKRKQRIMARMPAAFSDRELWEGTFDNDDGKMPAITAAMRAYADNFLKMQENGKGLLLYGDVGTGKSFMAACVVNALDAEGYACMMTNFSRLTNKLAETWDGKQQLIDNLGAFDLVVIDDLGAERDTDFMNENVTTIIDSLYRAKTPMIITSNYTPKQLTEATDIRRKRVYDRLLERCHPVLVDGPSRRKQMGREEFHEMNRLLGLEDKK